MFQLVESFLYIGRCFSIVCSWLSDCFWQYFGRLKLFHLFLQFLLILCCALPTELDEIGQMFIDIDKTQRQSFLKWLIFYLNWHNYRMDQFLLKHNQQNLAYSLKTLNTMHIYTEFQNLIRERVSYNMDNLSNQRLSAYNSKVLSQSDIFVKRKALFLNFKHHSGPKISSTECLRIKSDKPGNDKFINFKKKLQHYLDKQKKDLSQQLVSRKIKRTADNVWHAYKQQQCCFQLKNCEQQEIHQPARRYKMEKPKTIKGPTSKPQFNSADYLHKKLSNTVNLEQYKIQDMQLPKKRSLSQQGNKRNKIGRNKTISNIHPPIHSLYITNLKDKLSMEPNRMDHFSKSAELKIQQVKRIRADFEKHSVDKFNPFQQSHCQIYIYSKELEEKKKELLKISRNIKTRKSHSIGMRIQLSKQTKTDVGPWSKGGYFLSEQAENGPHLTLGQA